MYSSNGFCKNSCLNDKFLAPRPFQIQWAVSNPVRQRKCGFGRRMPHKIIGDGVDTRARRPAKEDAAVAETRKMIADMIAQEKANEKARQEKKDEKERDMENRRAEEQKRAKEAKKKKEQERHHRKHRTEERTAHKVKSKKIGATIRRSANFVQV